MSTEDILKSFGFKMFGSCQCSGTLTYKYERNPYRIKHAVKKDTVKVYRRNVLIKNTTPGNLLESYLVALGLKALEAI